MSEPSEKDLLKFINDLKEWEETEPGDWDWKPESLKLLDAIRRLIEKGPEVDEEFVQWAQSFLNPYPGHGGMNAPSKSSIRQVLGRAGVRLKESADE
jgi:hypothetical protein